MVWQRFAIYRTFSPESHDVSYSVRFIEMNCTLTDCSCCSFIRYNHACWMLNFPLAVMIPIFNRINKIDSRDEVKGIFLSLLLRSLLEVQAGTKRKTIERYNKDDSRHYCKILYLNIYSSAPYGAILLLQLSIVIHIAAFLRIRFS